MQDQTRGGETDITQEGYDDYEETRPHIIYPWAEGGFTSFGCRSQWHPDNIGKVNQGYEQEPGNEWENPNSSNRRHPLQTATRNPEVVISIREDMDHKSDLLNKEEAKIKKPRKHQGKRTVWWQKWFGVRTSNSIRETKHPEPTGENQV